MLSLKVPLEESRHIYVVQCLRIDTTDVNNIVVQA